MRSGWYETIDAAGTVTRHEQSMINARGQPKGMQTILTERGKFLNDQGHPLVKLCNACKTKLNDEERRDAYVQDNCCCYRVLSKQPDFEQQTLVSGRGRKTWV